MKSKEEILAELYEPGDDGGYDLPYILAAMEAYSSQDKWVSVEDRLPKILEDGDADQWVIGSDGCAVFLSLVKWDGKNWYDGFNAMPETRITHWQPLPAPPKTKS